MSEVHNSTHKVSVIIPLFNRKDLVIDTLNSLFNQTYTNWEAIIIDDGSTDGSYERVQEIASGDIRIQIFRRQGEGKGASVCRNEGIERATGAYVVLLDSDDLLAPFCLEQRVKVMAENPDYDFAVFSTLLFEHAPGDMNILWNIPTDHNLIVRFLNMDVPWCIMSPIWKKNTLIKIGKLKSDLASWQDWELHIRAIVQDLLFEYSRLPPDNYCRVHNSPTIGKESVSIPHLYSHERLFGYIEKLLRQHKKLNTEARISLAGLYFWLAKQWRINHQISRANQCWAKALFKQLINPIVFIEGLFYIKYFNSETPKKVWVEDYIKKNWKKNLRIKFNYTFRKVVYEKQALPNTGYFKST
jgi:glycosyltransferase involved in cell wall biosynthesis